MINLLSPVNNILRNPLRVLNHLDLINRKLKIASKWSLIWNSESVNRSFQSIKIRDIVLDLKENIIDIQEAINGIQKVNNTHDGDIVHDMIECYNTGLLEFHPTDICDLSCIECHYRSKEDDTIPFSQVGRLLKGLSPRAITVTGGGEPNVYKSESKNMNDLILEINQVLPDTDVGLINNNTQIPPGDWVNHIAWQRSSIDASSQKTYLELKRADKFNKAVGNVKKLLHNTNIPFVGIGFLYRNENVHEIKDFIESWFTWFKNETEEIQRRFNIQFRSISPAIDTVEDKRKDKSVYINSKFRNILHGEVDKVINISEKDDDFKSFILNNTNFGSLVKDRDNGNIPYLHAPRRFNNCYNALTHRVLRANGDEYPDFLLCNFPNLSLGNTFKNNSDEEKVKISLMQFYYFNRECAYCNPEICRQGWVSKTVEDYYNGVFTADTIDKIPLNYFF
ncbi:MAG: hypothetical protein HQK89_01555 [Nitrospirae bacterium]|nr:hypothetical protein [Nitrospirota bacterium]